jgi:Skp family chaperone for outer membrane proteins
MRVFIGAAALCVMLAAAPSFAQAPSPQAASAPQGQAAPPQAPAPAMQRPFPTGTKYAFVNIQRIAAESAAGKTLAGKVQALNQQKVNELNERNKALQASQQKLEAGATVLSPTAVAQLQKDIERQQIDIQRFTEDAQQDVTNLQTQLQDEFQVRLSPIVQEVATERGLHMLFSVVDSGLVWADPSLDITTEVIQKFDAARAPAAAASAPRPAAPAAPAPRPAAPAAPAPRPAAP